MRLHLFVLLSSLSFSALAAEPVKLEPLPPPPALPPASAVQPVNTPVDDRADEPAVTITKQAEQTVEEYRVAGRLFMIKVTPKGGVPYYLVDDRGDGKFARQESLDTGFRPPQWIIHRF